MADKINGRTPEEIKKGLECFDCDGCAYSRKNNDGQGRCSDVEIDALAYIQQLEAGIDRIYENVDALRGLPEKIQQLERERDAAVEQLRKGGRACSTCKFSEDIPENDKICEECRLTGTKLLYSNWEWAGPQEVE